MSETCANVGEIAGMIPEEAASGRGAEKRDEAIEVIWESEVRGDVRGMGGSA